MRSSPRGIYPTRTLALVAGLELLLAAGAARADVSTLEDDLGLSGTLRGAYFSRDLDDQSNLGVASLWATARPQPLVGISTYFDGRIEDQDATRSSRVSADLREGYAQTSFGDLDIRLGRQITVWGRADKVNPTDVWSVRDLKLLTTDDDDQRLGVTAIQSTYHLNNYSIIGLWQPEWRDPVFPVPGLPAGIAVRNVDPFNSAAQFGLKLDHSGEGVDWSISFAHVIDKTPDLAVPTPGQLDFVYHPIDVVGADAAVPVGEYGLRGEIAYTRTKDRSAEDPFIKNSNLFLVLGAERTFDDGELNVNAQYLYRRSFGFQDLATFTNPEARFVELQEDINSNQLSPDMQGASLRINYKAFNETLESEIAAVAWSARGDFALRPKISYAVTDSIKAVVGVQIYLGPTDSYFGRLSYGSTAFVELRQGF